MIANDNIGMKMSELVMWISEFQLYTWVMLNSLMFRITDYVGSQWAILNRTVMLAYDYNGPRRKWWRVFSMRL